MMIKDAENAAIRWKAWIVHYFPHLFGRRAEVILILVFLVMKSVLEKKEELEKEWNKSWEDETWAGETLIHKADYYCYR